MTVGQETLNSGRIRAIARQRNGGRWGPITFPAPTHARTSSLGGLACVTTTYCMAVGDYQKAGKAYFAYAARWNGTSWHILPMPNARGETNSILNAVACPARTHCVAVGYSYGPGLHGLLETYARGTWHLTVIPRRAGKTELTAVSCPGTASCVAAGYSSLRGLILAWQQGSAWTAQATPATGAATPGSELLHVSCATVTNCMAVGFRFTPKVSYSYHTLAESWDGHTWTIQPTRDP